MCLTYVHMYAIVYWYILYTTDSMQISWHYSACSIHILFKYKYLWCSVITVSTHVCFFNSTVPDQVSRVRFVPSTTKNAVSVEWSRPQSDAPILHYEIRSRQLGHSWQGPIRATTEMVTIRTSLVPSASYGVQVRAVSAIGAGPYSREEELVLQGLFQCTYIISGAHNWLGTNYALLIIYMCTCISYAHKRTHIHTNNGCAISTLGHAVHVQLC